MSGRADGQVLSFLEVYPILLQLHVDIPHYLVYIDIINGENIMIRDDVDCATLAASVRQLSCGITETRLTF